MSFKDYKIDYNHCLGSGVFGTVYAVFPRPENEKGFFSYWFPYAYDYIFRDSSSEEKSTQYCVKISKTAIRMVYENPLHPFRFKLPWHSLFEAKKEEHTNQVLQKNGLSNICFFKTNSFYSQFKTRVIGKTLHDYIDSGELFNIDHFELRKKLVNFMRLINNPKFTFWEIHENNLMYDEQNQQWEIVDGIFNEISDTTLEKHGDNINFFLEHLLQSNVTDETKNWLKTLSDIARCEKEYTIRIDESIREQMPVANKIGSLAFNWG
ncbi:MULTISPECIES: hypothetical protein [unclassified Legionella]|uniref:hypothetical protein n=1 Tax=unclassified Legionella TaxID=2622702 RepID=UPI001054BFDE|nr:MULTISPECIES: hypothetical protein [unclassified Legionella]MDI9818299.1 hypothetical protein [Legionella sp. PL877]